MRGLAALFLALVSGASSAAADVSLTLWLKSVERSQQETICVVSRGDDGTMTLQVQQVTHSFPARPQPILATTETSAAFDAALARITDGTIRWNEMNPDLPWHGIDGMELRLVANGSESLLREAGLEVVPEILTLFDPLGEGTCTRLADR
jgi:hypothetical protein